MTSPSVRYSQGIAQFSDLFAPPAAEAADFIASLLPLPGRVLDIGAGVGWTAFFLATAGYDVTALEPDREMFAVLLARLAQRREIQDCLTPVPAAAGFRFAQPFDLVASFAVLHLLPPAARARLVRYAASQARADGLVVLEIPVAAASRSATAFARVGQRRLGAATVEKYSAIEPAAEGRWLTHWTFRVLLDGRPVHEVSRSFDWYPLPLAEAAALVASSGLDVIASYGDVDRSPFVEGESRTRLVVARPGAAARRARRSDQGRRD